MKFFEKTEGQSDFHGNGREYKFQSPIGIEGFDPSRILMISFCSHAPSKVPLVELRENCDQTFNATMTATEFFELLDEMKQLAIQETGQIPDGFFWRAELARPSKFTPEFIDYVRKDGHWWRLHMADKIESDRLPGPSGETPLEKNERIKAMKKAAMLGVM